MSRRIPGKVAAVIVALAMTAVFGTSALAWTGTGRAPGSGYLPHSCDYIRTNVWLSTMSWNYYFNTQSSTWVIGNCPYYPYITDDVQYVQVNGVAISVSFPWAVGVSGTTLSSSYFDCEEIYTGYCGNVVYNIHVTGGIWWNNYEHDSSRTILWYNTQPYYGGADTTGWW
ncbi:MAG: hypothetical protein E6I42_01320 [Chloroflexi bacterium]|nr:MAG: hypothetical protein E6I42_01320 [Chloroflexota bacterium]TMG28663.1 MAG: hypothetical protein E6H97_04190 [Chloroflexota bacterium]